MFHSWKEPVSHSQTVFAYFCSTTHLVHYRQRTWVYKRYIWIQIGSIIVHILIFSSSLYLLLKCHIWKMNCAKEKHQTTVLCVCVCFSSCCDKWRLLQCTFKDWGESFPHGIITLHRYVRIHSWWVETQRRFCTSPGYQQFVCDVFMAIY